MTVEYVAIIAVGAGGSWARAATPEAVVEKLGRIVAEDWSGVYDVGGKPFKVAVFEVEGTDWVIDLERGCYRATDGKRFEPVGLFEGRVPERKRARHARGGEAAI